MIGLPIWVRIAARHPTHAPPTAGVPRSKAEGPTMRDCKLCRYSTVCNDLPGVCILGIYAVIIVVVGALGYLFVTQELL